MTRYGAERLPRERLPADKVCLQDFYQGLLPLYKPEPGFEKESFKPVRNINQVCPEQSFVFARDPI